MSDLLNLAAGVYPNMPFSDYQRVNAINFSRLKAGLRSAAHLRHAIENTDDAETADTRIGHAFHTLVWQPHLYDGRYHTLPDVDGRTKAGIAARAEAGATGKCVLRCDEAREAGDLAAAVRANDDAAALIESATAREVCIVWEDEPTGIMRKALIDGLRVEPATAFIADTKSTRDASPDGFARSIQTFGYHVQLAGYREGVKAAFGLNAPAMLIACEKDDPHAVAVYELDDEAAAIGWAEDRRLMSMLKECRDSGVWPAYGDGVRKLGLPRWAARKYEEVVDV